MILLLLPLITTALWYLGTRATITQWLWSRYSPKLARFMDCAACAGFWWGVVAFTLMIVAYKKPLNTLYYVPVIGLSSMVWTPLIAYLHDQAMLRLGSAVSGDGDVPPQE